MNLKNASGKNSQLTFWSIIAIVALIFFFAQEQRQSPPDEQPARSSLNKRSENDIAAKADTSVASRKISTDQDSKTNLIIPFSPIIRTAPVNDLLVDSRGTLWIATESGLSSYANGMLKNYSQDKGTFPAPQAECLAYDGQKIWVGTLFGLYSMTRTGRVQKHEVLADPAGEIIWDVAFDGITVWAGTQAGAAFLDKEGKFVVIDSKISNGGLRHNWCQRILRFSSWFVAVHDKGLSFWNTNFKAANPKFWKNIDNAKSSIIRPVSDLTFDGKHIWLATAKGVLYLTTPLDKLFSEPVSNFISYTVVHGLPANRINSIIAHKGSVWVGTDQGLARIHHERIRTIIPSNGQTTGRIKALSASGDILWLGSETGIQFINTAMVD